LKDIDEEITDEIGSKLPAQNVPLFYQEVLVDESGIAINDTETLSIATRYFSPALISALKKVKFSSKHKRLDEIFKSTKLCLENISTTKLFPAFWQRLIFDKVNLKYHIKYISIFKIKLSEEDMVAFLACMCILLPSEISFWKELDELLANQIPQWSFNCSLFCAYCISSSTEKLHHHGMYGHS
jgi:hypothetical protein